VKYYIAMRDAPKAQLLLAWLDDFTAKDTQFPMPTDEVLLLHAELCQLQLKYGEAYDYQRRAIREMQRLHTDEYDLAGLIGLGEIELARGRRAAARSALRQAFNRGVAMCQRMTYGTTVSAKQYAQLKRAGTEFAGLLRADGQESEAATVERTLALAEQSRQFLMAGTPVADEQARTLFNEYRRLLTASLGVADFLRIDALTAGDTEPYLRQGRVSEHQLKLYRAERKAIVASGEGLAASYKRQATDTLEQLQQRDPDLAQLITLGQPYPAWQEED
jgi:hypothetical protein